jgi:DNA-directed RNA polymerase subunit K/omega
MFRFPIESKEEMFKNKFTKVLIAAIRARELRHGHTPKIIIKAGTTVTAVKEVEQGCIGVEYLDKIK